MTNASASALYPFWHPGYGAIHYGASPDQAIRNAARLAASAGDLAEIWTNVPALAGCGHFRPDMPGLLGVAGGIARARGRGQDGILRPVSGIPLLALVLDLPGRLTGRDSSSLGQLLAAGRAAAVSVTLILPARQAPPSSAGRRVRAQMQPLEPPCGAPRELAGGRV